ncbi:MULTISPECIES: glycerate kinase [Sanguibacteroides]|nr:MULTISPECIES: glycerate kinase [Sanguibacteroides]PXZ45329.1 glycerate kinase [Sanguibacteroides justesenii]
MNPFPPKILLAPNAFKGSLSAFEACHILSTSLKRNGIETISLPMGDGGDGTAAVLAYYYKARPIETVTCDALGRTRKAIYYVDGDTAIIELAESCGIKHLKREEYDILNTNTAGFGIMIRNAIECGFKKLILCIGGSASVDGGMGALREIGLSIEKKSDTYRNDIIDMKDIHTDYIQNRFKDIECTVLCDVDNPITGEQGAAFMFGPQKGASSEQVILLNEKLHNLTCLLESKTRKSLHTLKHGGAAGGIALSFCSLLNAKLVSGSTFCIELARLRDYLSSVQAVITGEGKIDVQSLHGKIPGSISDLCRENHKTVYAIAGMTDHRLLSSFDQVFTLLSHASSVEDSIINAKEYLKIIAQEISDVFYASIYSM